MSWLSGSLVSFNFSLLESKPKKMWLMTPLVLRNRLVKILSGQVMTSLALGHLWNMSSFDALDSTVLNVGVLYSWDDALWLRQLLVNCVCSLYCTSLWLYCLAGHKNETDASLMPLKQLQVLVLWLVLKAFEGRVSKLEDDRGTLYA